MDPEDEEIELQNGVEIEGQEQDIMMQNELIAVGKVNSVNGKTGDVILTTSDLENDSDYQTGSEVESAISEAVAGKQDKLTAGDNITIENNVISASDTTYTAGNGLSLNNENEFSVDTTVVATQQNLSTEVTNRENADINLQGQIDAISASSDVVDIVGTYAELQAYDTQHLKDNDIIKVLQDETQNNATTYYRWSTHTQTFTLIGQEGPYYTKASADAQFVPQTRTVNSKALSSNITLTASDVSAVASSDVVQVTGSNTTKIMSQKATTDALGLKLNISDYVVDNTLADSTNPVQNKVLYGLLGSMPSDFFTGPVTVNGNGRDITLTGTMNAKLSDVKMYGDTTQQTYSGKNLFDKSLYIGNFQANYTELSNGIRATTTVGGNYTAYVAVKLPNSDNLLGKTVTLNVGNKQAPIGGSTNIIVYESRGAASVYGNPIATLYGTTKKATFTFPASYGTGNNCFAILFYCNNENIGDYSEYTDIQLELGSTATPYEPYVGGTASPNPDYPQDVNVVTGTQTVGVSGKNLFNLTTTDTVNNSFDTITNTYTSSTRLGTSTWIQKLLASSAYYTFSCESDTKLELRYCFSNQDLSTADDIINLTSSVGALVPNGNLTVNNTENAKYLYITFRTSINGQMATLVKPMLEESSTPSTYEPYQGASYDVHLTSANLFDYTDTTVTAPSVTVGDDGWVTITYDNTAGSSTVYCQYYTDVLPLSTSTNYRVVTEVKTVTGSGLLVPVTGHTSGQFTSDWNLDFSSITDDGVYAETRQTRSDFSNSSASLRTVATFSAGKGGSVTFRLSLLEDTSVTPQTFKYTSYYNYELAKMGTYQDYIYKSGDDWYVKKECGKIVLNGGEAYTRAFRNKTNTFAIAITNGTADTYWGGAGYDNKFKSEDFTCYTFNYLYNANNDVEGICLDTANEFPKPPFVISLLKSRLSEVSIAGVKSWLSSHNVTIYYPLATAADTQITNANLISDLNALWNALSYDGQTNFAITASGLSGILDVTAFKKTLAGLIGAINR